MGNMHNIITIVISYFHFYGASDLKIIYIIISFLFAVPFFLYSLFGYILSTVNSIIKNNAVNTWASTEGTILRSEVIVDSGCMSVGELYWSFSILYSFKVNEKEYKSDRVAYFTGLSTRSFSETIVNNYPINSTVTVFYNLKNPEDCCLYKSDVFSIIIETAWCSMILLIVPFFFFLSSYGILVGNKLVELLCFLFWPGLFVFVFCKLTINRLRKKENSI
jgi:hypothetical protein